MSDPLALRSTFEWTASRDPNDETFGDVVSRTDRDGADQYDAVLVGEPYDGAVIGRRGARTGPREIRTEMVETKTHQFDAGPVAGVGDLGDVAIRGRYDGSYRQRPRRVQQQIRETVAPLHDLEALPVFLGGDNSLTYANAGPLLDRGSVGAISFDAHLDCRSTEGDVSNGSPYRQLLEDGLSELAVVGARHFETSTTYHDYLRDQGGTVVTAEECADPTEAARRALEAVSGVDHLYVSVDVDVLTAAAAPGVSAPTPGGLSTRELYRALRVAAGDDRLAGLEVVECAPKLEDGNRTARAAARAVAHGLSAALD